MSAKTKFELLLKMLNLRVLPLGRALYALRCILREAQALGAPELEARCQTAITSGKQAHRLLMRYQGDSLDNSKARGNTRQIDQSSDRNLAGMFAQADNAAKTLDANHPRGAAGRRFLRAAFARGLRSVTQIPFEEQLTIMESIRDLCHDTLADDVKLLGLEDWAERHDELTELYAESLAFVRGEQVGWPHVKEATEVFRINYNQAVVILMASFIETTDEHEAARQRLLAPIFIQQDAVSALRKRNRKVIDVDPTTGTEIDIIELSDGSLQPS
ncbi:MAG: hypothetical protein H0U74_10130 [Bradymonadaceae bacterium]|nr:hypothetical protein [Lujinxingiaceae bacterium]